MSNLYDLEQKLIQQRRAIAAETLRDATADRIRAGRCLSPARSKPALRTRVGRLLIRLGARLAA